MGDYTHMKTAKFLKNLTIAGYATVEEFVRHLIEKEVTKIDDEDSEDEVKKKLQELGYLS